MDLNIYVERLQKNGGNLTEFAKRAGISRMYLTHMLKGRKKKPGFEVVLGLLNASDGEISIRSLRPDLFPPTTLGKRLLALFRKAASA